MYSAFNFMWMNHVSPLLQTSQTKSVGGQLMDTRWSYSLLFFIVVSTQPEKNRLYLGFTKTGNGLSLLARARVHSPRAQQERLM